MKIVPGQRMALCSSARAIVEVEMRLTLPAEGEVEIVCLMLGVDGRAVSGGLLLGGGNSSSCGGVLVTDSGLLLKLEQVSLAVDRLVLGVALRRRRSNDWLEAGTLGACHATARPRGGEPVRYEFCGQDFARETALQLFDIYRKDGWRIRAVGAGFLGGLAAMVSQYGARLPARAEHGAGIPAADKEFEFAGIRLPGVWPGGIQPVVPRSLVDAIGLVVVETTGGEVQTGTGFAIGPGGWVLTAAHTVIGANQVRVSMHGTGVLRACEVIALATDGDIALLWLSDRQGAMSWLLLAEPGSPPPLGEEVALLAFPLGLELGTCVTYSQGIINSHRVLGGRSTLQIDAGAAPGSSGGPLFRRSDGRVVGILTGGRPGSDNGMHINFASDVQFLHGIKWFLDSSMEA